MKIYRQIADLHIANLDRSFLASLGPTFLSEVYNAMDKSDNVSLFYESIDGKVIGFITGGTTMGPIYKAMLPRIAFWAVPLAFRLLSIERFKRVLDIIRYSKSSNEDLPQAELFSITVSPSARGKGVAPKLYNRLLNDFKEKGVEQFRIIVGKELTSAHKFYIKMGAKVETEIELHEGETSKVYLHNIL